MNGWDRLEAIDRQMKAAEMDGYKVCKLLISKLDLVEVLKALVDDMHPDRESERAQELLAEVSKVEALEIGGYAGTVFGVPVEIGTGTASSLILEEAICGKPMH